MKKFIPVLIIILLSATSCIYTSMINFTDEDLLWLRAYNENDSLFFRTPDAKVDTMVVYDKQISNERFPLHFNPNKEDIHHFRAGGRLNFRILGINTYGGLNGMLLCYMVSKDSLSVSIRINEYRCYDKIIRELKPFSLNDSTFADCLILDLSDEDFFDNKTPPEFRYPQSVTNIVWSRSKGLLQYTVDSTQVFSRQWN